MKKILIRVLAALGLVPVRRYMALKRRVDDAGDESRAWKKRADKATARVELLEKQLKEQVRLLKESRIQLKEVRHATDRRNSDVAALQTQLVEAERALAVAREQLMAIEVKLDILEGAANVLDARTRTSPQRQPGEATSV